MEYLSQLSSYFADNPYIVVLIGFLLIFFFFPLTEEAVLFIGGYLSSVDGSYVWIPTLLAGIFGVFITDFWSYYLARLFGRKLLKKPLINRVFPCSKQEKATNLVRKYGIWSIIIVRFIPGGIRNPVFFICGLFGISKIKFIITALSGAIVSAQISFWIGYVLHDTLPPINVMVGKMQDYSKYIIILVILIILTIHFIYKFRKKDNNC